MQQADKSIRVRNAGEDLLRGPVQSTIFGVGLGHCPCATLGMRAARIKSDAGAAGAAFRPVVPPPLRGKRNKTTGKPWGRTKHGAMTCV